MDGYILSRAREANESAQKWKAYAEKLDRDLAAAQANLEGYKALKDAAIKELSRVDPSSFLTVQQNRQKVFEDAFYASRRSFLSNVLVPSAGYDDADRN